MTRRPTANTWFWNADEVVSGTFPVRQIILQGHPFMLIEGMATTAYAVGATKGFIYLRSEYPHAAQVMDRAIRLAETAGWIGPDAFGAGKPFDLELRIGAGAYICGEETSLLESLEGKRGLVRAKPPLPALSGLFGKPTLINNVLTLAAVPYILADGAKTTPISAWAAGAAPCPFSSAAMSCAAG